jgi:tetratricopeptide (TPR) repeat protein
MIQVEHPEYLLALLALPVMIALYYFLLKWKKKVIAKIGDAGLVNELIKDYSPGKFSLKFILIAIAFTIGVIALANPRIPKSSVKQDFSGIDVMVALDVSNSMLAEDIKPDRLDRAKEFISKLIDQLPDDRIGLVVFAGRAYLQMPLTIDHDAAKMYLSTASTESVPTQGTVIGDALKMCYAGFNPQEKKYRSIILITDGEDHDDNAIKITKAMAQQGVMVNTVGIGSPEGAIIEDPQTHEIKKDANGNIVVTKLNEDELKEIAANGNGIYQLFDNTDNVVANLNTQLKSIGQKEFAADSMINYQSFFQWFLGVTLLLLVVEFFLSENKKQRKVKPVPTVVKHALPLFVFLCSALFSFGQKENSSIRKGNKDYQDKKFDKAIANYQKATTENPANYKAWYNLGNALYKNGKADDAVHAYDEAIQNADSATNKETAWYNKGVVLQSNKKLPECIDAYKNALRLNPDDADARLNLQKALQLQKQQQQQKQDNNKQQQNKQDQKKDKNQPPKQDKNNQQQQQPQQQQPQMSKEDAEEKLNALAQQEKDLQDKLRKTKVNELDKPEKDW